MSESIIEQATERLRTNLAAIVADGGATYWYSTGVAYRVPYYEDRHLDSSRDPAKTTVLVRMGDETHEEHSSQTCKAHAEVFVLVAIPFRPATERPEEVASPTRMTLVNRMVRDILRAVWADPQLAGLVENVAGDPITVDREREVDGWAMAETRLSLAYSYERSAP